MGANKYGVFVTLSEGIQARGRHSLSAKFNHIMMLENREACWVALCSAAFIPAVTSATLCGYDAPPIMTQAS
ncbi:hypothetical protein BU24DRAFT_426583 [Aaosphaeria arxii CBS 175.79]|uniref:Uncharacterized protein n=1 Tax=Aaosphaeria arxii CBS 175.79 TaxID=1450172 RepID=A0A6A5XF03_9PLEO|nr:uncharacterized protein BU24DRAFT_426583 [Aaosphaeria arxii CBS 175.79]KAF2011500.1 hypothetical protein BU24DRAFT_426583 [Aaosphaeria arxii CBS 175.79]